VGSAGTLLVIISRMILHTLAVMILALVLRATVVTIVSLVLPALGGVSWLLSAGDRVMTKVGRASLMRLLV
jgi:hypothetical protein